MDFTEKKKMLEETAELIKLFPESLQEKVFDFLILDKIKLSAPTIEERIEPTDVLPNVEAPKPRKTVAQKKATSKAMPQIIKDLNLRPNGKQSLQEIFSRKNPNGNIQSTAVMVYYLQTILECVEITANHVFSCYRELGIKIPGNLDQNLRDCASSKYGYIVFAEGKCSMSVRGTNFVEQDLPKKAKKA